MKLVILGEGFGFERETLCFPLQLTLGCIPMGHEESHYLPSGSEAHFGNPIYHPGSKIRAIAPRKE